MTAGRAPWQSFVALGEYCTPSYFGSFKTNTLRRAGAPTQDTRQHTRPLASGQSPRWCGGWSRGQSRRACFERRSMWGRFKTSVGCILKPTRRALSSNCPRSQNSRRRSPPGAAHHKMAQEVCSDGDALLCVCILSSAPHTPCITRQGFARPGKQLDTPADLACYRLRIKRLCFFAGRRHSKGDAHQGSE
jgi:hypothetical protein